MQLVIPCGVVVMTVSIAVAVAHLFISLVDLDTRAIPAESWRLCCASYSLTRSFLIVAANTLTFHPWVRTAKKEEERFEYSFCVPDTKHCKESRQASFLFYLCMLMIVQLFNEALVKNVEARDLGRGGEKTKYPHHTRTQKETKVYIYI